MNNSEFVLVAENVHRSYIDSGKSLEILKGVNLKVKAGEFVAIVGSSGSGKSTLLHCLGGLDAIDSGSVTIGGENLGEMSEKERTNLRNKKLGFVYQFHHLLPEFTACENVSMPLRIRRISPAEAMEQASAVLDSMGLSERRDHLPSQLSGGERQRVAIARGVVSQPICLLADEPTGNLDRQTADTVIDYLMTLARKVGVAVVIVTHDLSIAARCDRVLRLQDGVIVDG